MSVPSQPFLRFLWVSAPWSLQNGGGGGRRKGAAFTVGGVGSCCGPRDGGVRSVLETHPGLGFVSPKFSLKRWPAGVGGGSP